MEHYLLFVFIAAATILSPGPGVIFTLTNSLRYGLYESFCGMLGIALGALIVAAISATSVGLILATSALAFSIMKYLGAAYLIYLGVKLWRSPVLVVSETVSGKSNLRARFLEGLSVQLSNPKAIFFFMSIFPQFISREHGYVMQFLILVATYAALVLVIHLFYASTAKRARKWLVSPAGGRTVNRLGGGVFMCFGAALATANK